MTNDPRISIVSDIQSFEYKPKLYYEHKCQMGKTGNDALFSNIWGATGSACTRVMPMMLVMYNSLGLFRKAKIQQSAECLRSVIIEADRECTQTDKQYLSDLVELSIDYSSITGNSAPIKTTRGLGKAWAGINRYTKTAAKTLTAPLNLWEQKQLMYAMYCAICIYLINSRVFRELDSISCAEGFSAYKKAISSGNKNLLTYGVGKIAVDIYKIADEGLFQD